MNQLNRGWSERIAISFVLLMLAGLLAMAQNITGTLSGIVQDKSGAVIPGATVTMTNDATGDIRRTTSNNEGFFNVSGVLAGTYTVTIENKGFSTAKVERLTFNSGEKKTLGDVQLEVSSTGTEVRVVDAVESLTPVDTGERQIVITSQQLQNVAIVGRSAAEFIKILPGFAATGRGVENRPGFSGEVIGINGNGEGGQQSAIGNFSANGTPTWALDITMDGAHVSDPGCNCATPVNPNPDMIREFRVQTSNFSAENVKGPVVISSVSKSGTREFHGSGYFFARHFALNSNDAFFKQSGQPRPNNQFYFPGGNIGGPVVIPGTGFNRNRDKLFFFTGFEYYKQRLDTGVLRSWVPTQDMLNGDFSNQRYLDALGVSSNQLLNAPTGDGWVNGRLVDRTQIDRGGLAMLRMLPAANADPLTNQGFNYVRAIELDQNSWQWLTRVDYNLSDNTKLFFRYNQQNELQQFPIQLWWRNSNAVPMPTPILGKNASKSIMGNLTNVLSPSLTNELLVGYTFVDFPNSYQDINQLDRGARNFPYQGIFRQDNKMPGMVNWAGAPSLWMPGGFDPVLFATKHLWTVTDNLSKVVGTHTFKFGGSFVRVTNAQPGNEVSNGLIGYNTWHGLSTGNAFADLLTGRISDYTESTRNIVRDMYFNEFSFYAQDSWKLSPRLTLEYGMRFQRLGPWTANNGIGNAVFFPERYSNNANLADAPGLSWHARDKSVPLSGFPSRPLFFAPRFGFAYDLTGRGNSILRGGYGRFVFHDPQLQSDVMDYPAGRRNTNVGGGLLLSQIDTIRNPNTAISSVSAYDPRDDRQPTTDSWSVTLSQRLPSKMLAEVAYVGNRSIHLPNTNGFLNQNFVPAGAMLNNPTGDPNLFRPFRLWQNVNVVTHNMYSNYNSLQATVARQVGRVNFTFAYTWSKALGIWTNADLTNLRNNYGYQPFDRRHIVASSYVINLPALRGTNGFVRGVAGGWTISGITQFNSGVPLQQSNGGNFNFGTAAAGFTPLAVTGSPDVRLQPLITCNPQSNLAPGQFINPNCFAIPQPGQNGPVNLTQLRGPWFWNSDLSLFKGFKFGEQRELQFRFMAYNFMNASLNTFLNGDPNLSLTLNEQGRPTNPRFGFADNQVGRRVIQLGVKFFF